MAERKKGLDAELESVRDIVRGLKRLERDETRVRVLQYAWAQVNDDSGADIDIVRVRGSNVRTRVKGDA